MNSNHNVITIEHARQRLGERGKLMTDQEIESLLQTLAILCNKVIDSVMEEKKHYEN